MATWMLHDVTIFNKMNVTGCDLLLVDVAQGLGEPRISWRSGFLCLNVAVPCVLLCAYIFASQAFYNG